MEECFKLFSEAIMDWKNFENTPSLVVTGHYFNPLSATQTKFTDDLSIFDHFVGLTLIGFSITMFYYSFYISG